MLVNTELNDTNISAINVKVIPIAAYSVNVCKFSKGELNTLDRIIKRELKSKQMLGKQASERDLPKKRTWRKRIKINEGMYASKQDCTWNAACPSRNIGGSKLPGEGKH